MMMPKQHFTMLAHKFDVRKHSIGGWFCSEKMDGQRCVYIPGTRGMLKADVPFANTDKDERYVDEQVCSGLWSRYGNVIHAPDWWLDHLPDLFLDGELWTGRGKAPRQRLRKIIGKIVPDDDDWTEVKYHCFGMPSPEAILGPRIVDTTNYVKDFEGVLDWWEGLEVPLLHRMRPVSRFEAATFLLDKHLAGNEYVLSHKQFKLPSSTDLAVNAIEIFERTVREAEGEGIIIRDPNSVWNTERTYKLLKVKNLSDDEAIVIGYITGRQTDKGSKLLGLMGALIVQYAGLRFELSGFTDYERSLDWTVGECRAEATCTPVEWAIEHPGEEVPEWIEATMFPRGSQVTFKYRALTERGVPEEARYWRLPVKK